MVCSQLEERSPSFAFSYSYDFIALYWATTTCSSWNKKPGFLWITSKAFLYCLPPLATNVRTCHSYNHTTWLPTETAHSCTWGTNHPRQVRRGRENTERDPSHPPLHQSADLASHRRQHPLPPCTRDCHSDQLCPQGYCRNNVVPCHSYTELHYTATAAFWTTWCVMPLPVSFRELLRMVMKYLSICIKILKRHLVPFRRCSRPSRIRSQNP